MPAKSAKQYRMMAAIAHGAKLDIGPSQKVAKEFIDKTPSKKRKMFMKSSDERKK